MFVAFGAFAEYEVFPMTGRVVGVYTYGRDNGFSVFKTSMCR